MKHGQTHRLPVIGRRLPVEQCTVDGDTEDSDVWVDGKADVLDVHRGAVNGLTVVHVIAIKVLYVWTDKDIRVRSAVEQSTR